MKFKFISIELLYFRTHLMYYMHVSYATHLKPADHYIFWLTKRM